MSKTPIHRSTSNSRRGRSMYNIGKDFDPSKITAGTEGAEGLRSVYWA